MFTLVIFQWKLLGKEVAYEIALDLHCLHDLKCAFAHPSLSVMFTHVIFQWKLPGKEAAYEIALGLHCLHDLKYASSTFEAQPFPQEAQRKAPAHASAR